MDATAFADELSVLADCALCPRECHVNRLSGRAGVCRSDASFNIASICIHKGEEPVLSGSAGICNIFFTNCNLRCVYCQNHQISDNRADRSSTRLKDEEVLSRIIAILDQGINRVGFVSPSHFVPQVRRIIRMVEATGRKPVWVYNSNGYDKCETLRSLEGMIGVYLPDLKYLDEGLAGRWSGASDYPTYAMKALKEMFRQKGSTLITDDDGCAVSGMIVRHLVLPGQVGNSLKVLRFLSEELSPKVHVSLMAQYYPTRKVRLDPDLGRSVTEEEYAAVTAELDRLGMYNGWVQSFESSEFYRPDFDRDHPFE